MGSQSNKHWCPCCIWEFFVVWGFKFISASLGAKFQQESSPPPILRNRRVRQGMNPRSAPLQLNVYMRIISGHTIWDMLAQKQLYFLTTSQNPDPTNCPEIATQLSKQRRLFPLFENNTHTESLISSHPQALTTSLPFKPQGKSLNATETLGDENQN